MLAATFALSPTVASHFVSNDGSLTVDVPVGAISAAQLATDGGSASLLLRQVLPGSGSNAGGSGEFSFGTYLLQVLNSTGQLATHGLLSPATLTFNYGNRFGALDMAHAFAVINPSLPPCVNLDPTSVVIPPSSSASSARTASSAAATPHPATTSPNRKLQAAFVAAGSGQTTNDPTAGTLTTADSLSSPSNSLSWGTNSPVATFGKPDPFEVNLSGASLTAGYTIDVPPGPKGFKPPITLTYNSAGVSDQHSPQGAAGWVGEGWNVTMGSISWSEHYVDETGGTSHWQNSWELSDPFGTSATLVPPKTNETIYWDDTGNPADYGPTQWQTVPETFAKVYDYQGTWQPTGWQVVPCWRVFLKNGVMEEFGCTSDSAQWYQASSGHQYITSWMLDLIIEPDGNQIHMTYQSDMENHPGFAALYPRDMVLSTVQWDSPGCLNALNACTGAQWAPSMQVSFQASHTIQRCPVSSCAAQAGNLRFDDPADLSGSGGMANPLIQSDFALNDILVQIKNSGTWNTLRDYQFAYDATGPFNIVDPVSGKNESTAGRFTLSQLTVVGDDGATSLPSTNFTYAQETEYYEDSLLTPTPSTNCGPSWNLDGGAGCRLWSQSYLGNSYYLSSVSNGLGLAQSFSWVNLRNNTHGVTSGGDASDPLYCTNHQNSQFPCDEADDETWSRIGLSSQTNSLVRLAGPPPIPVNGTTAYTYKDVYPLPAQECPTCVAGFSWGNQDDNDYLDFYNGKFMGFAQVSVSNPDGSIDTHKYDSTEGWGVYNTAKVLITCPASPPDVCHNDPWWDQTNALHGHEFEVDHYATDGVTLLGKTLTYYTAICTPSWVPAGSPPVTNYGNWDGNLVSTLDLGNPVAPCWLVNTEVQDYVKDGSSNSSAPLKTSTYAYENAARPCSTCWGRLISKTTSSNDGSANGSPTSIVNNTAYLWHDSVCGGCRPVVGTYLVDFVASTDTEDVSTNHYQCTFHSYDGLAYATGSIANFTKGHLTESDSYSTTCGTTPGASTGAITTTYGFDQFGNPIWSTDADANANVPGHTGCTSAATQRTTCTTFDTTFDALVWQQYNAKNQMSSTAYDSSQAGGFGMWPTSTQDPNGAVTSYIDDKLGRPTSLTLPAETGANTQTMTYNVTCSGTAAQIPCAEVDQTQRLNNTTTITSRAFYDGMGHLAETRSPAPNCEDVVQYYYYDPSQRLAFKSIPYFVTAYTCLPPGSPTYSTPATVAGTSYAYDDSASRARLPSPVGRSSSVTDPLSGVSTSGYTVTCNAAGTGDSACYEQLLTVDPLGHQTGTLTDALGRTNYEQRYNGNSLATYAVYATAKYKYNYVGSQVQIVQPDGVTTTRFTYDLVGRKTGVTDPDRGSETYGYDPNGNLTQSVDARGGTGTVYDGYDGLNRQIWRNTSNSPTGAYDTYSYDSGSYGIGRLTGETFSGAGLSGSYSYVYDARGRQTSSTLYVGSNNYPITTTAYNDADRALSQTYPDGEVVQNLYDSASGWLTAVTSTAGSTTTTLLSNAQYTNNTVGAYGEITGASLDGTTPVYAYSATIDALGRATDLKTTKVIGGSTLFDQARAFDPAGNVTTANTTLTAGTDRQAFCYDEQNRLTAAASSGTVPCQTFSAGTLSAAFYNQSFGYDNMGRLTSGPLGVYTYGNSAHVHAATAIGSAYAAAYDSAGDMTCRAPSSATTCSGTQTGAQLSYNNEGQLSNWQNQPSNPTSTAAFLYDGQGNRVAQQVTSAGVTKTAVYVGNLEEDVTSGGTTTKYTYYYANGQRFAMAINGVFGYLASDGLGSANVTLDANGNVYATELYAPYGYPRYASGTMPTDYGFTGQHSDGASGLDYYGSRYYDPIGSQFASADTILPGAGFDIWGLSRYAYVEGNPVIRTDPTGNCSPMPSCLAQLNQNIDASQAQSDSVPPTPAAPACDLLCQIGSIRPHNQNLIGGVQDTLIQAGQGLEYAVHHPMETALSNVECGFNLAQCAIDTAPSVLDTTDLASGNFDKWVGHETPLVLLLAICRVCWRFGAVTAETSALDYVTSADTRAAQLQAALSPGAQGRVTMAAGYASDASGNVRSIIGTSEPGGYLRPGVRGLVLPSDLVADGLIHAEQNIVDYAYGRGWTLIAVGAGRPICAECAGDISGAGGIPASALGPQ